MFNKKAQIEIQFNWIFVIIAGIVFLGFFLVLMLSQFDSNEQKVSITLAKNFNTILDSVSQQSDVLNEFKFPSNFKFTLICDNKYGRHSYELNDIKADDIKYDIIFSKPELYGRTILPATKKWELPNSQGFTVTNFLYLSNDLQSYIFVNSSNDKLKKIYAFFPNAEHVHLYDGSDIERFNYDTYNVILLDEDIDSAIPSPIDGKTKYFTISSGTSNVFKYGEVCISDDVISGLKPLSSDFKSKCETGGGEYTQYLGEASLYGIIFSGDVDLYQCMMEKAFKKLRLSLLMQYDRILVYNQTAPPGLDTLKCKTQLGLDLSGGPLETLYNLADPSSKGGDLDNPFEHISTISTSLDSLQSDNRILASYSKCIELY